MLEVRLLFLETIGVYYIRSLATLIHWQYESTNVSQDTLKRIMRTFLGSVKDLRSTIKLKSIVLIHISAYYTNLQSIIVTLYDTGPVYTSKCSTLCLRIKSKNHCNKSHISPKPLYHQKLPYNATTLLINIWINMLSSRTNFFVDMSSHILSRCRQLSTEWR